MGHKVIWSENAIEDLRQICAYIAEDNPEAAAQVGNGIIRHVEILESFPLIGPTYPRGSRGPTRQIVYGNYRIFYDGEQGVREVKILHVRHGARDEPCFAKGDLS